MSTFPNAPSLAYTHEMEAVTCVSSEELSCRDEGKHLAIREVSVELM